MGDTVNMHVRDIPKEVKDKLATLAAREHMSLNAYVVRLLEMESRFADNARLLGAAPNVDISRDQIAEALREAREERDERW
jgi:plasmid stability protein